MQWTPASAPRCKGSLRRPLNPAIAAGGRQSSNGAGEALGSLPSAIGALAGILRNSDNCFQRSPQVLLWCMGSLQRPPKPVIAVAEDPHQCSDGAGQASKGFPSTIRGSPQPLSPASESSEDFRCTIGALVETSESGDRGCSGPPQVLRWCKGSLQRPPELAIAARGDPGQSSNGAGEAFRSLPSTIRGLAGILHNHNPRFQRSPTSAPMVQGKPPKASEDSDRSEAPPLILRWCFPSSLPG